jgi:hypothetical protein
MSVHAATAEQRHAATDVHARGHAIMSVHAPRCYGGCYGGYVCSCATLLRLFTPAATQWPSVPRRRLLLRRSLDVDRSALTAAFPCLLSPVVLTTH